jgi:HAD superfamily hydrolase (TIGR01509 family)/HAD superfamily hydrolase (TIGR01549 family)
MEMNDTQSQHDGRRYDGLVFDVGGTLTGLLDPAPFQEFLDHSGLPATEEDARRLHRELISVILAERDNVQGLGADGSEIDAWWAEVFTKSWPHRPDLAAEMYRWWRADHFDRVFPDAVPALEALRQLGMPMGILSNWSADLEGLLRRLGLRGYFDFVIVSALVGLAKPDPRIFDLAVAEADQPRQRLLYVGDHVGDDIEGARAAGLDAVLIDRRNHHPEALCSRIGSLLDLVAYVQAPRGPARAIIFDMDGVVLDSMPAHLLTWQQTLAPLGIRMTAEDLYPLEGIPTERTAQRLTERFLGEACSEEEARRLASEKRTLFRQIFQPTFIPGIAPLLHDLRGRGYRLGLVTGSARSVVDESLAPTGVADLFETLVTGDQVSRGKPDPEPYRTAADRLDLPPAECLAVENAPLGIHSAKGAGMQCVALETTLPAAHLSPADRVFPDAPTLRAWLLSH